MVMNRIDPTRSLHAQLATSYQSLDALATKVPCFLPEAGSQQGRPIPEPLSGLWFCIALLRFQGASFLFE